MEMVENYLIEYAIEPMSATLMKTSFGAPMTESLKHHGRIQPANTDSLMRKKIVIFKRS